MGIGAQRRELTHERDDFCQRCGALSVGNVALFCGIDNVSTAPQIMERLIHHDHARTVLVSHLHTGVHRIIGHRRAQLFVAVPGLHSIEA